MSTKDRKPQHGHMFNAHNMLVWSPENKLQMNNERCDADIQTVVLA